MKKLSKLSVLLSIATFYLLHSFSGLCQEMSISEKENQLDFRFSPPEWQTAICLPDDPHKSLVDKSGELLYHYKQGGREFGTRISIDFGADVKWVKQELYSPRVPIVKTFFKADGFEIIQEAFADINIRMNSLAIIDITKAKYSAPARDDYILVHVKNTGSDNRFFHPELFVNTGLSFSMNLDNQGALVNNKDRVRSSLTLKARNSYHQYNIILESLNIPAGQTSSFYVQYTNCSSGEENSKLENKTLKEVLLRREKAIHFWENNPLVPFNKVQVPDPGIQALLESSIRNIWQAREIKKGLPAFQVGPTCYRGLWIVDGAFLLEAAAMLGAGDQARNGVAYELTTQKEDGRIESLAPDFWKENGIVLWTCIRHAQLTQDKAWLESVWPKLQLIAEYIKTLRRQTLQNDSSLDDGLQPAGTLDGGIGGTHDEYTNTYWNLTGLNAFIRAAKWLGKMDEAEEWQREYDEFMLAFEKAAKRDMGVDPHGNPYLPMLMGKAGTKQLPQRAQWAFCHAVYPGQIFPADDPLASGNLRMLEDTEKEGMVYGTGWDATGIWNYFASFYGHAWLWLGEGRKAANQLYAFGNHAAPTLVWREEQSPKGEKFRKVGDMPHNWASAEFIRLMIHLLAIDRSNELHLFEGLPTEWLKAGMVTKLEGIATPFGVLSFELKVNSDGSSANLNIHPLSDKSCENIIIHLDSFHLDHGKTVKINPGKWNKLTIDIN